MIKAIDSYVRFFRVHEREPDLLEFKDIGYGRSTYFKAKKQFRDEYYDEWVEVLEKDKFNGGNYNE